MAKFFITKVLTAYLTIDCENEEEARKWGEKIRATLEDEDGETIPPQSIDDFEAESRVDDTTIELLEEEITGRLFD